jgi:hypothetical protein
VHLGRILRVDPHGLVVDVAGAQGNIAWPDVRVVGAGIVAGDLVVDVVTARATLRLRALDFGREHAFPHAASARDAFVHLVTTLADRARVRWPSEHALKNGPYTQYATAVDFERAMAVTILDELSRA